MVAPPGSHNSRARSLRLPHRPARPAATPLPSSSSATRLAQRRVAYPSFLSRSPTASRLSSPAPSTLFEPIFTHPINPSRSRALSRSRGSSGAFYLTTTLKSSTNLFPSTEKSDGSREPAFSYLCPPSPLSIALCVIRRWCLAPLRTRMGQYNTFTHPAIRLSHSFVAFTPPRCLS